MKLPFSLSIHCLGQLEEVFHFKHRALSFWTLDALNMPLNDAKVKAANAIA